MREAEAVVIILYVETPPHPLGLLMDEAEDAVVVADMDSRFFEDQPEIAAGDGVEFDPVDLSPFSDFQYQGILGIVKLEIEGVGHRMAVDLKQVGSG